MYFIFNIFLLYCEATFLAVNDYMQPGGQTCLLQTFMFQAYTILQMKTKNLNCTRIAIRTQCGVLKFRHNVLSVQGTSQQKSNCILYHLSFGATSRQVHVEQTAIPLIFVCVGDSLSYSCNNFVPQKGLQLVCQPKLGKSLPGHSPHLLNQQ